MSRGLHFALQGGRGEKQRYTVEINYRMGVGGRAMVTGVRLLAANQPWLVIIGSKWMDYSQFKGIQFLLFFGAALGLGVWQVIAIKRQLRRDKASQEPGQDDS